MITCETPPCPTCGGITVVRCPSCDGTSMRRSALDAAARAWRAVSVIRRGEVLHTLSLVNAPGWVEALALVLAADVEPRRKRARKAAR